MSPGMAEGVVLLGAAFRNAGSKPDRIIAFRDSFLKRVVRHAHERVPLYRDLWDAAGVRPGAVGTIDDLARLPVVARKDFRARSLEDSLARGTDPARLIAVSTTGSTGEPFTVRRTRAEDFVFHVFRMRAMTSFGLRAADRVARIGTHAHRQSPLAWRAVQRLGLFRQAQVPLMDAPGEIADALARGRPDVVTGNSAVMTRVARELAARAGRPVSPRFAVTSSEMLTPGMRRRVAEGFGCPVYDTYCAEEFGLVAWECRETGLYHVCDDSVLVEVLKDGRPAREGERGEIVVTALHFRAQPFVRYRLGDEVVAGPSLCPCGAPFSTLAEISGRSVDHFRLPGGRELYAAVAAHVLQARAPWVEQYEVVQERVDLVRARLVPLSPPPAGALPELRDGLASALGPGVAVELEVVREIVPPPGAKSRFLRSMVGPDPREDAG